MNADGSGGPTRLTNNPADDHDPDWSPDGEKLAFFSDRTPQRLLRVGVDDQRQPTARVRRISRAATIFDADPSWSPDGTQIAFVRDAGGQNFEVWTADADGTNQVNLTPIGGRNSVPRLGPDRLRDVRDDLDRRARELDAGRGLGGDRGHPARRDPRRDGTTAGASARRHPARRHPARRHPLGGIPLGGIPLGGIGFTAENLNQNGLGGVPLSTIPLVPPGHVGGAPRARPGLQRDASAERDAGAGARDAGRRRDQARGPHAGLEPARRHPAGGIALGSLPLGGIPLSGDRRTRRRGEPGRLVRLRERAARLHLPTTSRAGRGDDARACAPGRAARRHPARVASHSGASRSGASRSAASRLARRSAGSRSEAST